MRALWDDYLAPAVRQRFQLGDDVRTGLRWLMFVAGLHDIGKCSGGFQSQDPKVWDLLYPGLSRPIATSSGHTAPGQACVQTEGLLPVGADAVATQLWVALIAQVVGGHHGVIPPPLARSWIGTVMKSTLADGPQWTGSRRDIAELIARAVDVPQLPDMSSQSHLRRFAMAACGVVPLGDWIVSQERYINGRFAELPTEWTPDTVRPFLNSGVAKVSAELEHIGLRRLRRHVLGFEQRFSFAPRGVQQSLVEHLSAHVTGPGLLVVMTPTGQGKTEAALYAAEVLGAASGAEGLFFGLPTMATTDAMFRRVIGDLDRVLDEDGVISLLHSMAAYTPELHDLLRRRSPSGAGALDGNDEKPAKGSVEFDRLVTGEGEEDPSGQAVGSEWTRGGKRGLYAPVCVATVDQLLAMALRSTHQPMRSLALSGKVVIVDEAHAYDSYMQTLLRRVLSWLGAFGAPVVLLSATLPVPVAKSLVGAYADGAARWRRQKGIAEPLGGRTVDTEGISYPGWVLHDARTGRTTAVPCPVGRKDVVRLHLNLREHPDNEDAFANNCRDLLDPIVREGGQGCGLVVVNTVRAAQLTYLTLRKVVPSDCELLLLHARLPQYERSARTTRLEDLFGKKGQRPRRAIVVATQVVEQSLDLDFDVVISELAPLALLLQRAGRCHRHPRADRAAYWAERGPKLHVLVATRADGQLAEQYPYPHDQRMMTLRALRDRADGMGRLTVTVPDDVQDLVDQVYPVATWLLDDEEDLAAAAASSWAQDEAAKSAAEVLAVPPPTGLHGLHELTARVDPESKLSTRLGVDNSRIVPLWESGDRLFLDPECQKPVPQRGRSWRAEDVATLVRHSIPVREGRWLRELADKHPSPEEWAEHPLLSRLVAVPMAPDPEPVPALDMTEAFPVRHARGAYLHREIGFVVPAP
ncbi:CRISPR-associated helicase, Cas3 family [Streptoalloteichus tenebrarius]|uniref:CRISPR-associated helicase, Cas3 family n=1 Tax=Streptoalloteichus tenebrarius (strain ATCC 17920 / DSM 40477 / JCM 4838 / CBS 697.72 / NBRC 16177 / NCIMB 11028 / NRRL B-12390 / A12253. 1 / ISP 5477) TaxID=1933 RepID=A0ABT1HLW7_STRSD|nr:CRISPR-associated helicase, Cas3 family [Streptoalloteichus tenebrarius]